MQKVQKSLLKHGGMFEKLFAVRFEARMSHNISANANNNSFYSAFHIIFSCDVQAACLFWFGIR